MVQDSLWRPNLIIETLFVHVYVAIDSTRYIYIIGQNILQQLPTFSICSEEMKIVNSVNLLGVNINSKCDAQIHADNRVRKCRMSYYGLGNCGMAYPGLATDVKSHPWRTLCDPVLSYGIECISLGKKTLGLSTITARSMYQTIYGPI